MDAIEIATPGRLSLTKRPTPFPETGEVLVQVRACGICGSDIDLLEGTRPSEVSQYPVVPGHEFSGEIVAVGEGVPESRIGERVAVDPMVAPPTCENCRRGWVCHCTAGYDQLGFTRDGGMAGLVRVPQEQAHRIPLTMSFEQAALVEPASCALHGVRKAAIKAGDTVAIVGAGPIGALAIQFARSQGPGRVLLLETDPRKLQCANELGADLSIDARAQNVVAEIQGATNGHGADAIIECSGNLGAIGTAFRYAAVKARIVLIGIPPVRVLEVDYTSMLSKDLTLAVSNGYTSEVWKEAMEAIASGDIRTDHLVTHRGGLSDIPALFELLSTRRAYAIKAMVTPGGNGRGEGTT